MEPTLSDQDLILVDLRARQVTNDAVYVLQLNEDLLVKRVQRKLGGSLLTKRDNAFYEAETLSDDKAKAIKVIGRVVWCGRVASI